MAWSKNGTPLSLGSALDDMDITDLSAVQFNHIVTHAIDVSGTIGMDITFNNNANSVYAKREEADGATDTTATTQAKIVASAAVTQDIFMVMDMMSTPAEDKLAIIHVVTNTVGAANAPSRVEIVAKFVPSPDANVTRADITNVGTGNYDTDSNITAFGTK